MRNGWGASMTGADEARRHGEDLAPKRFGRDIWRHRREGLDKHPVLLDPAARERSYLACYEGIAQVGRWVPVARQNKAPCHTCIALILYLLYTYFALNFDRGARGEYTGIHGSRRAEA